MTRHNPLATVRDLNMVYIHTHIEKCKVKIHGIVFKASDDLTLWDNLRAWCFLILGVALAGPRFTLRSLTQLSAWKTDQLCFVFPFCFFSSQLCVNFKWLFGDRLTTVFELLASLLDDLTKDLHCFIRLNIKTHFSEDECAQVRLKVAIIEASLSKTVSTTLIEPSFRAYTIATKSWSWLSGIPLIAICLLPCSQLH